MWTRKARGKKRRIPSLPPQLRVYAIGDVHGRADLLDDAFARIDADLMHRPVGGALEVLLGDYIDRGPASRQVLDRLIERSRLDRTVFLKGNHETFISDFFRNPTALEGWRQFGALETLMSYGLKPKINADAKEMEQLAREFALALPDRHRQFLANLKTSFICGDYLFVHAGVRPGVPLNEQREQDLLWIREDFLFCEEDFGKIIVHGHTPVPEPDIRPNRINIDTGAYATGKLTCIAIEGDQIVVVSPAK